MTSLQPQSRHGGFVQAPAHVGNQDAISVQEFLLSLEAMLRLDEEHGFIEHYSRTDLDPFQKIHRNATQADAYRRYQRAVKVGFDPTEGIVRMEVTAADPVVSATFSHALIGYAEERLDERTSRLRQAQVLSAKQSLDEAEGMMRTAQNRVLRLQQEFGVFDPDTESSHLISRISTTREQLAEKQLELRQLLDNSKPNRARVAGVTGDIARLEELVAELKEELTAPLSEGESLASASGRLRLASAELESRTQMTREALQALETARQEAARQIRYLSISVRPVAPMDPSLPKILPTTSIALLLFSGIYLMISITIAILREQFLT